MISNFNLTKLNNLLKDFYILTKIRITVFDDSFNELAAYPTDNCSICALIRANDKGNARCKASDQSAFQIVQDSKTIYTYTCHAGLTESVAPIIIGNIVIGYLFFGQSFAYDSANAGYQHILNACTDLSLSTQALHDACLEQPFTNSDYITSASHILHAVAAFLCMDQMVTLHKQELPAQIDAYVQQHFTENISAVSLCDYFEIGKTKLYEIAKQNYGMGIAEYIRKLRIEKAKELLQMDERLSLAQIAESCGFTDYNYFITVFKKQVGVSPKKYATSFSISLFSPTIYH